MTDKCSGALVACKFGGSSVATPEQVRRVEAIVRSDVRRRHVVVSAPGSRFRGDRKVTDLLYEWHRVRSDTEEAGRVYGEIRARYRELGDALQVKGVDAWLDEVEAGGVDADSHWVASRGEYLQARLIAAVLRARFVDAADLIRMSDAGELDPETYRLTASALAGSGLHVIPGFYGKDSQGRIRTFSRGGSDITGAIVARSVEASVYENWTDVDGLLMADPRIVENSRPINEVTYRELRELGYMGASIFHDEAVFPVRQADIPIHIRNTNRPSSPGTWIRTARRDNGIPIVGIAGRKGFSAIHIEKSLLNRDRTFRRRLFEILEACDVPCEHAPSSIDSLSVILRHEESPARIERVLKEIRDGLAPDRLDIVSGLALIATVGQGMAHRIGMADTIFRALAQAEVNIRMINQGASEINVIVGVADDDFETAIRAIYHAFVHS